MDKLEARFSLTATATAFAEADQIPKIKIVANAGSVMSFGSKKYALDVDGVVLHGSKIPLVYGHDLSAGIGHSTEVKAEAGQLIVSGVVSRQTEYSRDFVTSSALGFPWQASVGGLIIDTKPLKAGETYDLHGSEIVGPCEIITKFELFEVSVVEWGADNATSAEIKARLQADQEGTEMKKSEKADVLEAAVETVEKIEAVDAPVEIKASIPVVDNEDALKASREAAAAEVERVAEIKARSNGADELIMATAIREGWTPDRFELESLRASRPAAPAAHTPETDVDEGALECVAIRAAGFEPSEKRYSDRVLTAADKIGACGLRDFIERASGKSLYAYRNDANEWIRAAFSTQNLDYILTRSVNAILLEAFNYTDNSWKKVFRTGRVTDFKKAERYRLDSDLTFQPLTDGGKIKHGEIADSAFEVQADTRAVMFSITRKDIINDDLGALTEIPRQFGFGASETINKLCWSLFMNPGNASDGSAFYSAGHGSLKTGSALTLENLSAARAAFITRKKQKATSNDAESPLGIPPTLLIVPTSLEDKALMLTKATLLNNGAEVNNPADYNPNTGRFQVVAVPFLEYANYTGNSDSTWYLAADPARLAAFEISFLNGRTAPTVERADASFDTLGVQYRAYIDFGVSKQDYRGIMKVTA